jgi:hypothetical protein
VLTLEGKESVATKFWDSITDFCSVIPEEQHPQLFHSENIKTHTPSVTIHECHFLP